MRQSFSEDMATLAVLVSGGGTNLAAIIEAIRDGKIKDARIGAVISNNRGAYALKRAEEAGIPSLVISPKEFSCREDFNRALLRGVQESGADLVVLAGFLCVIPEEMVRAYPNRIINIHPSLIPSFSGKGFYGLKVHEKALERGVKVSGATVHFVDAGTDTGPIIRQKAVEVLDTDTPKVLQRRIMEEAEWVILPEVIQLLIHGRVKVEGRKVSVLPEGAE